MRVISNYCNAFKKTIAAKKVQNAMTSTNLTRIEAEARADMIGDVNYDITIDITVSDVTFPSKTVVTFDVTKAGDTFIDLIATELESVTLDGADITQECLTDGNYLPVTGLPLRDLSVGEHILEVVATCKYSNTGQGLHRFVDPEDEEVYFYTQFETADAKRVFACFDQPDLKATYSLHVTAPKEWEVIMNTAEQRRGTNVHCRIPYKLSTYLVAICAGPYIYEQDIWHGKLTHHPETPESQPEDVEIPLGVFCRKSLAEHLDAKRIFTETKQGFDFYHAHFGMAYPFDKYDQLFVPEFNAGAMENAGAVTFRDEYIFTGKETRYVYERRCETILHEMAHMWFGDLVTMKWWDDLWLNESFATWGSVVAQAEVTEYNTAWVTFANIEKSWAYQQDQLPSTHPVSTDASDIETVEQNFDGITYAKGASVLKQLQAYVGRDAFFAGVRKHFANHAYGNATFDDLLEALAKASNRDLSQWADQWLKTTGINDLVPEYSVEDGKYSEFAVLQFGATPGKGELRTHRIAIGLYSLIDGQVIRTDRIEVDVNGELTEVPEIVGKQKADLVLVNDDDLTYCMMKLDADSLQFVIANIDKIVDPLARSLCWSASWEMTRNAEMRARDFIGLVCRGAAHETEISVLDRILSQAATALNTYADPTWAATEGKQLLADAYLAAAETAEPGSDKQLVFVQKMTEVEPGEKQAEFFEAITNNTPPLRDLTIDHQLRWKAVTALIAAGLVEDETQKIAAIAESDKSSNGRNAAIKAQAAIPTEDNKKAVLDELVAHSATLGNLIIRYKLEGLKFIGSAPLLMNLSNVFFSNADSLWGQLDSMTATTVLTGIYPSWDISQETVEKTAKFLEKNDLPTGVRRIAAEGSARIERALKARIYDAS